MMQSDNQGLQSLVTVTTTALTPPKLLTLKGFSRGKLSYYDN